jgi:hypothetical protein
MTKDDASNWNCTNGIMVDESDPFKTRLALLTSQRIPKKLLQWVSSKLPRL